MGDLQPLHPTAPGIGAPAPLGTLPPEAVTAEDEQVQVQLPWTPTGTLLTAERPLERLERDEQGQGPPFGVTRRQHVESHHRVVEVRLIEDTDGARGVQPGDADKAAAGQGVQGAHRTGQGQRRVTQVGAQPQVRPDALLARGTLRGWTMAVMAGPLLVIFHQPPGFGEPPLTGILASARHALIDHQLRLFGRTGLRRVLVVAGRDGEREVPGSFGERLAGIVERERPRSGVIVLGSGAVPLLRQADATRLVEAAGAGHRRALTNNRYSSDVCAVSEARALRDLPPLSSDNALPRWLEDVAGFEVRELRGRQRLALDLDTPLDLALMGGVSGIAAGIRRLARMLRVPRAAALRVVAMDPHGELLVAGRTSARTLRWLERRTRCRVRALIEERGLKASLGATRPPRSVLGRLLDAEGPEALGTIVADLADGAVIDSRVLLAHRLGADERAWPSVEDRFASDLLLADAVTDPWLAALTRAAAASTVPIQLGAHTLVGPGIRLLLGS